MTTISALDHAKRGIQNNLQAFNDAAMRVSRRPLAPDAITNIARMKQAEIGVKVNVKVFQVASRMAQHSVDIFA